MRSEFINVINPECSRAVHPCYLVSHVVLSRVFSRPAQGAAETDAQTLTLALTAEAD